MRIAYITYIFLTEDIRMNNVTVLESVLGKDLYINIIQKKFAILKLIG